MCLPHYCEGRVHSSASDSPEIRVFSHSEEGMASGLHEHLEKLNETTYLAYWIYYTVIQISDLKWSGLDYSAYI